MFVSHGIWFLRTRDLRKKATDAGLSFDELPEAKAWQDKGYDVGFDRLWQRLWRRSESPSETPSDSTD